MGEIISVWSSTKKTGKTVFLYSLSKQLSNILDKDLKILLCCMNFSYGNLMRLFNIDKEELNLEDIVNFKMHPNNKVFDLVNAIARYNNNYFIGSKKTNASYADKNITIYENLLEELKKSFDLIFIDTVSGRDNPLTNMTIQMSDFVLNVISQDKESLDGYPFITEKEIAFIVNMYSDIYPDVKDLTAIYGLKNLFALPYCSKLQEMKNKGNLELYIQHESEYNNSIKDISCFLVKKLNLPLDKSTSATIDKRHKNFFRKILEGSK